MLHRVSAGIILLVLLLSLTSCGTEPTESEVSTDGQEISSVSEASEASEPDEPLSLDEYLSEERCLPDRLYTPIPREAEYRYEAFSDGLYRIPKGELSGELWLEGSWTVVTYNEDVVYLMAGDYLLYRVPAETAEPELIADLSEYLSGWESRPVEEQGAYSFSAMYGETLYLFSGADGVLYGLYLPAREVYELGEYPDTDAICPLTNRSFLYQLPTGELAEDGFSYVMDSYLCSDGKYYRVLSGTDELLTQSPLDPAAIAAFLPIEDGRAVIGDRLEEISRDEAMSAANAYTASRAG